MNERLNGEQAFESTDLDPEISFNPQDIQEIGENEGERFNPLRKLAQMGKMVVELGKQMPQLVRFTMLSVIDSFDLRPMSNSEVKYLNEEQYELFKTNHNPEEVKIGEYTSPFAVEDISKMTHEEKEVQAKKLKKRVVYQQEAGAMAQTFLKRIIKNNPDTDPEELKEVAGLIGNEYEFAPWEKGTFNAAINNFVKYRTDAKFFLEKYPDTHEFIRKCFKVDFDEGTNFLIELGSMSINIHTDPETISKIYEAANPSLQGAGGFMTAIHSNHNGKPIDAFVTLLPISSHLVPKYWAKGVKVHEEQHAENKLLSAYFDKQSDTGINYLESINLEAINQGVDSEKKKALIAEIFYAQRAYALQKAKNEIIAYLKGGVGDADISESDDYDYLSEFKDRSSMKDDPDWQQLSESIFGQYPRIIQRALGAFKDLSEFVPDKNLAIALLSSVDLLSWPLMVKRIKDIEIQKSE